MSTIVTRSGKGSPLTHNEVDANFTNLNTDKVEKTSADITGGTINNTSIGATTPSTGSFTKELINQSYDQGTGVLQVAGTSTFNGTVVDKTLSLQGGNNLLTYSQLLSNAAWIKAGGGLSGTLVNAPDGTTTAYQFVENLASGTYHGVYQNLTVVSGGTYTFSIYLQASTRTWACINMYDTADRLTWFNLTGAGSVGTNASGSTASITSVGGGWYRCSVSRAVASSAISIFATASTGNNVFLYTGDGSSIFLWGAQLEAGTVASAYTPTTTVAITTTNNISVPSGTITSSGLITSNSAFYSVPTAKPNYILNSTGSYYGQVSNVNSTTWSLGFGSSQTALGTSVISWDQNQNIGLGGNADLYIIRDAANTLAQRNSTNAQTFRLYNTYTDASNYERLSIDWSTTANTATIVTQNAGTGSARTLAIGQDLFVNSVRVGRGGGNVSSNTAVGLLAINDTATGISNSAFGNGALQRVTSGNNNAVGGALAMNSNTTGGNNTAFGYVSLYYNVSGSNNSAYGYNALSSNTTASNLTAIGRDALQANTTNVATLGAVTGGSGYTNGTYTGVVMTLSSGSTAVTYPTATIVVAGGVVTTVTIISAGVGFKDTTTVLTAPAASIGGTGSGFSVPVASLASGITNTAVGYQAGFTNSIGNSLTFVGYQAGYSNTTGTQNTFNGYVAGYSNTTGTGNSFFGFNSGLGNTSSSFNSAFGSGSLQANTINAGNSAFGQGSLSATTSANNTGMGTAVLFSNNSGANNVGFGYRAGYGAAGVNANTTGSNNTYIGYQTVGSANNNTNEMVIGYTAVGLGSNTTVIGNSSTTLTKAFGVIVGTNYTVATLPSASTSGVGARAFVTDALAPTFGSTVTGGSSTATPVYSDGTNWKVG